MKINPNDPTTLAQGTGAFQKDIKETLEIPDTSKLKGSRFLKMITGKTGSVPPVDAAVHPVARMFSAERKYQQQKKAEEEQRGADNAKKAGSAESGKDDYLGTKVDYLA